MRGLVGLLLLVMLSGCWWIGPPFYHADPATPAPLSAGRWSAVDADGTAKVQRLARYPDGSFGPAPGEEQDKGRIVFHALAVAGRELWITQLASSENTHNEAIYGLAERRGELVELLPLPDCEGNEALVRAAGGTVKVVPPAPDNAPVDAHGEIDPKNVGTTCLFTDAASLERAMTAFAARHPRLDGAVQLRRVGD